MSWAGMSGSLAQARAQHLQLPPSRLRDRFMVRPLRHRATRDAKQFGKFRVRDAQAFTDFRFREWCVHAAMLSLFFRLSSPLAHTVRLLVRFCV